MGIAQTTGTGNKQQFQRGAIRQDHSRACWGTMPPREAPLTHNEEGTVMKKVKVDFTELLLALFVIILGIVMYMIH